MKNRSAKTKPPITTELLNFWIRQSVELYIAVQRPSSGSAVSDGEADGMKERVQEIGDAVEEGHAEEICRQVHPQREDDEEDDEIDRGEEGKKPAEHREAEGQADLGRIVLGVQDLEQLCEHLDHGSTSSMEWCNHTSRKRDTR